MKILAGPLLASVLPLWDAAAAAGGPFSLILPALCLAGLLLAFLFYLRGA